MSAAHAFRNAADIVDIGPRLSLPAHLSLGKETLELEQQLRHLPGRRTVFAARIGTSNVIAKVYTSQARSRREFEHERAGLRRMATAGLPAPAIIAEQSDDRGAVLVMEKLHGKPGRDVFPLRRRGGREIDADLFISLLTLLNNMWQHGVLQRDIHLDNFMLSETGDWKLLDVGGMTFSDRPVSSSNAASNFALFMAQFPPQAIEPLWRAAAGVLDAVVVREADKRAYRIRQKRMRKIVSKTMRNCTEFEAQAHGGSRAWFRRDHHDAVLEMLDAGLDHLIEKGKILKDGNSTTVALVDVSGTRFVIKRYNLKNLRKRLTRQFSSHARQAWQGGAFLSALGLVTPVPVLYLSERNGPLVGREFLVTEFVEGESLPDVFGAAGEVPHKPIMELARFFRAMTLAGFSHGDTKWTNFVFTRQHELVVMDLDGMSLWPRHGLRKQLVAQRQRFLRNWPFPAQRMQEIDRALVDAERELEAMK